MNTPKFKIGELVAYKTGMGSLIQGRVYICWPDYRGGFVYKIHVGNCHYFLALQDRLFYPSGT